MMCVRTERTECRVKNIKIQCQNHCRFFSNFCCQFYFHQIFNCFDNIFRSRKRDTMRVCGHFRRPHFTSLIFGLQGGMILGFHAPPENEVKNMSGKRDVILWLDDKMISCDPLEGMPVKQVLKLGRLRGFTRKEIKSARKALGVLSIEYDGEWYWRYPFEHFEH